MPLCMNARIRLRRGVSAAVAVAAATSASAQTPAPTSAQTPAPNLPQTPAAPTAPGGRIAIPERLTLADAIRIALQLQPDLIVSQADRQAASERLRQANARFYPTVSPQFTYSRNYTFVDSNRFVDGTDGPTRLPQSSNREVRDGDISLRYQIYDSGRREINARQSRSSLRAFEFADQDTRQAVIGAVADAYFVALRSDALVNVSQAQVARAQNTLEVVRAQVDAGVSPRKDTFQAEADLANAQVQLLQTRNDTDLAQAQLKNTLGLVGGGRLTLADVPPPTAATPTTATLNPAVAPATPAPSLASPDASINDYVALAYRTRPDIAQSLQSLDVTRASVRLAQIDAGVTVNSDAALGYQYLPDRGNNREITAQISYPLFDAGLSRAQVRENQASVRAAEARLESLRQQIAVEVEQAYRVLAEARARVPAAEAAQRAAQVNYDAALESRREGVGTIVDVITAQTQLVQAQTNLVQAVYDFYTADARLARAVGQADRIAR